MSRRPRLARDLDLGDCLSGEAPRVINTAFPGGVGRWEIRRSTFRQGGRPHELLVLSDLSQPLREEELNDALCALCTPTTALRN